MKRALYAFSVALVVLAIFIVLIPEQAHGKATEIQYKDKVKVAI